MSNKHETTFGQRLLWFLLFHFIVLEDVREDSPLSDKVTTRQDTTKANFVVFIQHTKEFSIKKEIYIFLVLHGTWKKIKS